MFASQVVLEVPDISCGHCVQTVRNTLEGQPGVQSVDVNLDNKTATVAYDENNFNLAQAQNALQEEGYPVAGTRNA